MGHLSQIHLSQIHYFIGLVVLKNSVKYFVNLLLELDGREISMNLITEFGVGKKKLLPQYHIRTQLQGTSLAYNEKKGVSGKSK